MITLLFVDDEPRVLSALRRMLNPQRWQWDMRFVESGVRALELLAGGPIDVVVTDYRMPGVNGRELLAHVHLRSPETIRIVLSGHTGVHDLLGVMNVAHHFLTKPCPTGDLVATIEAALAARDRPCRSAIPTPLSDAHTPPDDRSPLLEQALELLDDPTSDLRAVAAAVARDPAASAKVFELANSDSFGAGTQTTKVFDAVLRLGRDVTRLIVRLEQVTRAVPTNVDLPAVWLDRVNAHALVAARLAAGLVPIKYRNDAACAAMAQEYGQIVLASYRPEPFVSLLALWEEREGSVAEMERRAFGMTHAETGAYLLSLWGFNSNVVQAVAEHDRPLDCVAASPITQAVQRASALAQAELGSVCSVYDHRLVGVLERLGTPETACTRSITAAPRASRLST